MLEGVLKPCLHRVEKPAVMLQSCSCRPFCKQKCCAFNCKMTCHRDMQTSPQICMCTALKPADYVSACYVSLTRVDQEDRPLSSAGHQLVILRLPLLGRTAVCQSNIGSQSGKEQVSRVCCIWREYLKVVVFSV